MKKVHYLQAGLAVKDVYKDYHNWSSSSFTIEEFFHVRFRVTNISPSCQINVIVELSAKSEEEIS